MDLKRNVLAIYDSCEEAGRKTYIFATSSFSLSFTTPQTAGGFMWRRVPLSLAS